MMCYSNGTDKKQTLEWLEFWIFVGVKKTLVDKNTVEELDNN